MPISSEALHSLAKTFQSIDRVNAFGWLDTAVSGVRYARAPGEPEPFLYPHLPFIGPKYEPGGIMIYATAQNQGGTDETRRRWWRECVGFGRGSLWRQFYDPARDDGV